MPRADCRPSCQCNKGNAQPRAYTCMCNYVSVRVLICRVIYMRAHLLDAVCHLCALVLVLFFDYQTVCTLSAPAATTSTLSSTQTHTHISCIQMITQMIKSAHTHTYTHTHTNKQTSVIYQRIRFGDFFRV